MAVQFSELAGAETPCGLGSAISQLFVAAVVIEVMVVLEAMDLKMQQISVPAEGSVLVAEAESASQKQAAVGQVALSLVGSLLEAVLEMDSG